MKRIDGQEITSSHRGLSLTVDKRDVANGTRKNPNACAAAIALKNHLPNCDDAYVHATNVYAKINGKWMRFRTSARLRLELYVFDRGGRFAPDIYDLLPVSDHEVIRRTRRSSSKGSAPRRRSRKPSRPVQDVRPTAHGHPGNV